MVGLAPTGCPRPTRASTGPRPRGRPAGAGSAASRWLAAHRAARTPRSPAACRTAGGDGCVRSFADHHRHVPRTHEAVHAEDCAGESEQSAQRGHDRDVIREHAEVAHVECTRFAQQRRAVDGAVVRSEAEEDDSRAGWATRESGRQRRIDDAHVGAMGFGLQQIPVAAGNTQQSPKVKITPGSPPVRWPCRLAPSATHTRGSPDHAPIRLISGESPIRT